MIPRFDTLDENAGFEVVDPIETRRFTFSTPTAVEPRSADPKTFQLPVSSACVVETRSLALPYPLVIYVRNGDGEVVTDLAHDESAAFPHDEYLIELNAPLKIYFRVEAGLRVESDTDSMRFQFDHEATVEVGARSFHESPQHTVTTTDDPEDAMAAVSTFGSVLKTPGCERSWPTLRGHPPRIERGDELAIPDGLDSSDTGVEIAVPPEWEYLYPVAPLAYYFGGEVVPGETPRLTVGGFEHRFDSGEGFGDDVVRSLKRAFLLDCVTRTEGYYPVELTERSRIESAVGLDFAELYDAPLDEQLSAYFSIPYEKLTDAMPTWHRVAYVRPDPANVEALPYLVKDLSILRTPPKPEYVETEQMRETRDVIDDFKRASNPGPDAVPLSGDRVLRRPDDGDGLLGDEGWTGDTLGDETWRGVPPLEEYVDMPDADALELAWVGDGTPTRGTKVLPEAFGNEQSETEEGVLDIRVVCNDEEMREEWDAVAEIYKPQEALPFDVDVHFDVSTNRLRELLTTPTDLFHYIGHLDGRGFQCSDGILDAETLAEVEVDVFLLNACRSHDQGVALVSAGSRGGIVSLGNVGNHGAIQFGETLAKLFQNGFTVGSALSIAHEYTPVARHYTALGDPGVTLAQSEEMIPLVYVVERETDPNPSVTVYGYPTRDHPIGGISIPFLQDESAYFLPGGPSRFEVTRAKLVETLQTEETLPFVLDNEVILSGEWDD